MPPSPAASLGGGVGGHPNAEEKAKRVRSLLSSYYGAAGAGGGGDGGSLHDDPGDAGAQQAAPAGMRGSPQANRVAGLDAANFDVDRWRIQ